MTASGYGASDPAPQEPRDLDDVTSDLNALLAEACINGRLVLVGASFGGMIVTYYAAHYPADVVGVVTFDVPAPSATLTLEDAPELAWDHPDNPEHVDVVAEFENRLAEEQFTFEAPLRVVTATDGQASVDDQAFWLEWSSDAEQVELEGGHNIYEDQPDACAEIVLELTQG